MPGKNRDLTNQRIRPEFLAQRAAVDAENSGCLTLIAVCVVHDGFEQRPFNFSHDEIVEISWAIAVKVPEIFSQCIFGVLVQRLAALRGFQFAVLLVLLLGHVGKILSLLRCLRNTPLMMGEVILRQSELVLCTVDAHNPVTKFIGVCQMLAIPGQML